MLFAEAYARWLLVLHTVCAGALVAASTHLVVWMRGFISGRPGRIQAVRKFSLISLTLYIITMVLGNVVYPVYKVRVRVEYLEQPSAIGRDYQVRREFRERAEASHRALTGVEPSQVQQTDDSSASGLSAASKAHASADEHKQRALERPRQAAKAARWFDVKEHWAALGCALMAACALALRIWNPKRHGLALAPILFLMALGACVAVWMGAIVGIFVSSYRAVGGI